MLYYCLHQHIFQGFLTRRRRRNYGVTYEQGIVWNGMENGMEWNGNFGMEYGRCQNGMEWKISRMERKTIFHTSLSIPYLISCSVFTQKYNTDVRLVINNIVTEEFNFNIYAYYLLTNCGTLVVYFAQTVYVLHLVSTMQFAALMLQVDMFDLFYFYFEIDNVPSRNFFFFSSIVKKIRICYFIPISA